MHGGTFLAIDAIQKNEAGPGTKGMGNRNEKKPSRRWLDT